MNKCIITLSLLAFSISLVTGQNKHENKCDYISSGYYQLVYEAEIAHLEGNDSLAFTKLQEAESRCPLINQFQSKEIDLYCCLLMKNRQFDRAVSYMDTLANKYGKFCVDVLVELGKDEALSKELLNAIPDFYISKIPELITDAEIYYYSPVYNSTLAILTDICVSDQNVRAETELNAETAKKINATDSLNYNRIFQFIDRFGFPGVKLYGWNNGTREGTTLDVLFMHISDHYSNVADTILHFVRNGQCSPYLYGTIIDRHTASKTMQEAAMKLMQEAMHSKTGSQTITISSDTHTAVKPMELYATSFNIPDDEIIDIEHLDERRIAIGMPTREMQQKRTELLTKRYEQSMKSYE